MRNKILVIEDDTAINNLLAEIVKRAGYEVEQAFSGTEGRMLLKMQLPSLILLDLMLPGMTGEELISFVRNEAGAHTPIIVLSARESGKDKVNALRLGADDYVTKPFDEEELLARIEANLRKVGLAAEATKENPVLEYKEITLDTLARQVYVSGKEITLTAREFDILSIMMSNPKKVFTKANIYTSVWNDEFYGDDNTVNVHISNLRSKLKGNYIQTVWGIGFKMQD